MNKMSTVTGMRPLSLAVLLLCAGGTWASAQDRFSFAVGPRDMLVVQGAQGNHRTELPLPSISQSVMVEGTAFEVSYGRDATGLLTAIIAPNPSQPQDLHFSVLGKSVDSNSQAVVTLTFSKALNQVRIDPGYVGVVEVNSQKMRPDSAANFPMHATPDRTSTPTQQAILTDAAATSGDQGAADTVATTMAPATAKTTHSTTTSQTTSTAPAISTPIPDPVASVAANSPSTVATPDEAAQDRVSDHAPEPLQVNDANQMPFTASATPGPSTVTGSGSAAAPKQHALFWAEPVTPPSGVAPSVGVDEMKLVEVQGSVSVRTSAGNSVDAENGMIIPSGSTVSTSDGGSAAVFMGGVNSVRLLPDTDIQLTQQLSGNYRKTVVYLHDGTVFSRVGHRAGETQSYQVVTPQGVAVAKGTEFADSLTDGHHYVFVVKGIVQMLINDVLTGTLTALPNNVASGAMPPASDGNKILFAALTSLQAFQSQLQKVINDINAGTATQAELTYYNNLKNTFTVMVDDVYDPTHPNAFLGAFTSTTGFGDSTHSSLVRPQDFENPNPDDPFNNGLVPPSLDAGAAPQAVFVTAAVDPGAVSTPTPVVVAPETD